MEPNNKDIDNLIAMLDGKVEDGVGRIKVAVSDKVQAEKTAESRYYGRCDMGECALPAKTGDGENS